MVMTAFTVTTFSQLFKRSLDNFEPGYYYDSSGNKVQGLLKFKYGGGWSSKKNGDCVLIFKKDKGDNKQTFTPLDINSFVIGLDSFGIVRNFSLTAFANYPLDFTKVEAAGKINLYTYYALSHSG